MPWVLFGVRSCDGRGELSRWSGARRTARRVVPRCRPPCTPRSVGNDGLLATGRRSRRPYERSTLGESADAHISPSYRRSARRSPPRRGQARARVQPQRRGPARSEEVSRYLTRATYTQDHSSASGISSSHPGPIQEGPWSMHPGRPGLPDAATIRGSNRTPPTSSGRPGIGRPRRCHRPPAPPAGRR